MTHRFEAVHLAAMALFMGAPPRVAPVLQLTPSPVVGGNAVTGTVTLAAAAPTGGTTVTISTSSIVVAPLVNPRLGPSSAVTSLTLAIPQGQSSVTFRINTPGVGSVATATITAVAGGESVNTTMTVSPASVLSVAVTPTGVTGGQAASATITLDGKAPPNVGAPVLLTASVTSLASSPNQFPMIMPASITVNPGAVSATVPIATFGVSSPTPIVVTASLGRQASTTFSILPPAPASVEVNPARLVGGATTTGTVVLNARAPSQGLSVALTSSSLNAIVPPTVTVPPNADRQTFSISTAPVSRGVQATVTAKPVSVSREAQTRSTTPALSDGSVRTIQPGEVSATLTIDPVPTPASLSVSPEIVFGGKSSTGTVVLTSPAPAAGITIGLASSSADVVLPKSVTVPAGSDRQTFQIATRSVLTTASVTIGTAPVTVSSSSIADGTSNTIQISGSGGVSAGLTILEQPRLQSVVAQPSGVVGGSPVNLIVTYTTSQSALSPAAMTTYAGIISASTNHPELVQFPASFSVAPVTTSGTTLSASSGFTASGTVNTSVPSADQPVAVTVAMGTATASTSFAVRVPAPAIRAVVVSPLFASIGTNVTLSIALAVTVTTSQTIQLTTDHPEIVTLPASVVVAPGRVFALSFVTKNAAAKTLVTITAAAGAQRVQSSFTVAPP